MNETIKIDFSCDDLAFIKRLLDDEKRRLQFDYFQCLKYRAHKKSIDFVQANIKRVNCLKKSIEIMAQLGLDDESKRI